MKTGKSIFVKLFTLFVFINCFITAQFAFGDIAVPDRPNPPRLVNDFAGLLTSDEVNQLEQKLDTYNDSTSTQIVVVIVNTLNDADPATYAYSIGDKWGAGSKKFDNGIVLLISKNDHQVFIATGKGMEGPLPDVTCHNIVQNIIVPNFKSGDFYNGIDQATDAMIKVIGGEFVNNVSSGGGTSLPWPLIIFIVVFIISIIARISRGRHGVIGSGGMLGPLFWGSMLGGGGGFGGGGSGFGGGGGGFGGFGGGSFGGGGAGGSW
jgi:uncharacterized protein